MVSFRFLKDLANSSSFHCTNFGLYRLFIERLIKEDISWAFEIMKTLLLIANVGLIMLVRANTCFLILTVAANCRLITSRAMRTDIQCCHCDSPPENFRDQARQTISSTRFKHSDFHLLPFSVCVCFTAGSAVNVERLCRNHLPTLWCGGFSLVRLCQSHFLLHLFIIISFCNGG